MVYKQDEFKATNYQEKAIEINGENQRIQNQGESNEGQLSLELLEVTIELKKT